MPRIAPSEKPQMMRSRLAPTWPASTSSGTRASVAASAWVGAGKNRGFTRPSRAASSQPPNTIMIPAIPQAVSESRFTAGPPRARFAKATAAAPSQPSPDRTKKPIRPINTMPHDGDVAAIEGASLHDQRAQALNGTNHLGADDDHEANTDRDPRPCEHAW